ncbi:MAG: cytochrome C [Oribacterium sp.]|nr:cytochrome C [Oribacterium sp.]
MKQIKNSEYEEFQKYLHDKNNGRILTPDGLRFICQANDYDPEKIGRHMLEVMARQQSNQARL